jgi:Bacterial SH3 domain
VLDQVLDVGNGDLWGIRRAATHFADEVVVEYSVTQIDYSDVHRAPLLRMLLAAMASVAVSAPVWADPVALSGNEMRAAVAGATVEIDTPIGTKVPVKYAADGSVSGEAGSVAFFLGSAADHGRWWVAREKLCHRWTTWFKGETTCLTVILDGQKIKWTRDDGDTGSATLLPKATITAARQVSQQRSTLGGPIEAAPPRPAPVIAATSSAPAPSLPKFVQAAALSIPAKAVAPKSATAPKAAVKTQPIAKQKVAKRQPVSKPAPMQAAATVVTFWVHGVAEDDVLNVRNSPSSEAEVVGSIPPQAHGVRVAGLCDGQWCPVQFQQQHGWVNRSYLVYEIPETVAAAR